MEQLDKLAKELQEMKGCVAEEFLLNKEKKRAKTALGPWTDKELRLKSEESPSMPRFSNVVTVPAVRHTSPEFSPRAIRSFIKPMLNSLNKDT